LLSLAQALRQLINLLFQFLDPATVVWRDELGADIVGAP
jgi:hypothetical protein